MTNHREELKKVSNSGIFPSWPPRFACGSEASEKILHILSVKEGEEKVS